MIGRTEGRHISISGLGCHVPDRVLTNDELSTLVDTNDEWIVERTGIRERRIAADGEALTDISLPAARRALEMAGADPASLSAELVHGISAALDGLPLALELAARQAATVSPERLLGLVRHEVTTLSRRGGEERQRSLDAMLAWSSV